VAKKVKGVVMTASRLADPKVGAPTFAEASASQMASVPLAQPMACGALKAAAAAASKLATCEPRMNCCESQTDSTA